MPDIKINVASKSDLAKILDLQKVVYVSEARIYGDYHIPPLTETVDEIEKAFSNHLFLKIESNGEIIGSVRASKEKDVCKIGRLIVAELQQNQGYGSRLLSEIETKFPDASRYELFTGEKSQKNLHLYKKNGYEIVRKQKVSGSLTLVFLHKFNKIKHNQAFGRTD